MRFVAKAARKSCLPCLSELILERAGAAGLGFLLVWIGFPCVHWPFGGPAPFGNEGMDRKRCKPRRTCGYFMKHQSVYSPERWDCLAVEQPLSL